MESIAEYKIHNYSEFAKFQNTIIEGDATYYSHYIFFSASHWPIISYWGVQVTLQHICNSDTAHIEFKVSLHNPDSLLIPYGSVWETPTIDSTGPLLTLDNTYFQRKTAYDFNVNSGGNSGIINAFLNFGFPTKGSLRADSAYFFSNLDYMSCKITAHKPK